MSHITELRHEDGAALRAVFESIDQAVFIVDTLQGRIVDANPAACQMLGSPRSALIDRPWAGMAEQLPASSLRRIGAAGDRHVVLAETSAKRLERRDPLTGLHNREALAERRFDDGTAEPSGPALLFIDLDHFKRVNDTWGHVVGDRVLQVVAERLVGCTRPGDLLVRYGGDEFVVLVADVRRRGDLKRLARRIQRAVQAPTSIAGRECHISASVGIARRTARGEAIEELIALADRDMYRAKRLSRGLSAQIFPAAS